MGICQVGLVKGKRDAMPLPCEILIRAFKGGATICYYKVTQGTTKFISFHFQFVTCYPQFLKSNLEKRFFIKFAVIIFSFTKFCQVNFMSETFQNILLYFIYCISLYQMPATLI